MKTTNEMFEKTSEVMQAKMMEVLKELEAEYGGRIHLAGVIIYMTPELESCGIHLMNTFGDDPLGWLEVASATMERSVKAQRKALQ